MKSANSQNELYDEFINQLRQVMNGALQEGVEPRAMAFGLLELSHEIARRGGPVVFYDHANMMRSEAKDLLSELNREYGTKLAFDKVTRSRKPPHIGQTKH